MSLTIEPFLIVLGLLWKCEMYRKLHGKNSGGLWHRRKIILKCIVKKTGYGEVKNEMHQDIDKYRDLVKTRINTQLI
jgi:hypothetical protein